MDTLIAFITIIGYAFLVSSSSSSDPNSVPDSERTVLENIYYRCRGPSWGDGGRGWMTPDTCNWNGVVCQNMPADNNSTHVVEIHLMDDVMRCQLPDDVQHLTYLEVLDVTSMLIGTIPDSIQNLTRLQVIQLFVNQLTGTLPDWIGTKLPNLVELDVVPLRDAPCEGLHGTIPASYANVKWDTIWLDDNSLSGDVPEWLHNVRFHHARGNKFTGPCPLPDWLVNDYNITVSCVTPGPGQTPSPPLTYPPLTYPPPPPTNSSGGGNVIVKSDTVDEVIKVLFVVLAVAFVGVAGTFLYKRWKRRQYGYIEKSDILAVQQAPL
eukprot:PhF_6_TR42124/c0_g1_i2/m.63617